jgi:hypothetical protein
VLSYATGNNVGVIPDIFDMADVSATQLTLRTKTFPFADVSGAVSIITDRQSLYQATYTSSNTLEIDTALDVSEAFVYGREIPDFYTLDKNAIFTINVAATQELDRQLQESRQTIADLLARVTALEAARDVSS